MAKKKRGIASNKKGKLVKVGKGLAKRTPATGPKPPSQKIYKKK